MNDFRSKSIEEIKVAALEKVKSIFKSKGNTGLARALEQAGHDAPTPQAISQWSQVPAERVPAVEAVSGVSRHLLRPDVFGLPEDSSLIEALFREPLANPESSIA